MRLTVEITPQDRVKYSHRLLVKKELPQQLLYAALGFIAMTYFVYLFGIHLNAFWLFGIAILYSGMYGIVLFRKWQAAGDVAADGQAYSLFIECADGKIWYSNPDQENALMASTINGWDETPHALYVEVTDNRIVLIPKRSFDNTGQLEEFRTFIIRNRVKKPQ
ncbi:YcxB family protein [Flavihumibacter petaseus]|uniref:YcxB-like C-terminal domain-containing protein n=1 Tax=Flavihumibacter petaseus NBRC 106054 TaxID=1220578 RepID=A0A0E9N3Q2_9BACT|nr:YcxB family protein [Flavihumibacter petaseus]GAO44612.1 hypothetical protein FPE01S_03_06500 [Flavihumibacter petaseus NBRC 106054]